MRDPVKGAVIYLLTVLTLFGGVAVALRVAACASDLSRQLDYVEAHRASGR